ncbi:hemolysin family protein [Ileibacterium valens]|uniref:hemolysin family protein n=1 Tax=Ileibacterium valens TaxID=1862668 RepID=UPI0024B96D0B|nr:CBS domain-containing protein [Ileibacterium valens]
MDSVSSICIALIFLGLEFLAAAAYTDQSDGMLHLKRRRNLLFWMSLGGFFGIGFFLLFLDSLKLSFMASSLYLFLCVFALLILNSFAVFLIMSKASNSANKKDWLTSCSITFMKISVWLFSWIPLRIEDVKNERQEELSEALKEEENTIDVAENALDLYEKTLDEICTHRSDVISIDVNEDPEQWRKTIMENRHTFYPVYNEGEEDIVGILDTRDYFRLKDGHSKKSILDHTLDQPFFVAENTTADELLHQMKKKKTYFAVVLDEYGGMTGIVTLHDILEELLGEITEAEDAIRPADIVKLPRGMWRISGSADLEEVSSALGEKLELDDFETFSGYILGTLGYIPEDGTQLEAEIGNLLIQITNIKNHRIRQTLVRKKDDGISKDSGEKTSKAARNSDHKKS